LMVTIAFTPEETAKLYESHRAPSAPTIGLPFASARRYRAPWHARFAEVALRTRPVGCRTRSRSRRRRCASPPMRSASRPRCAPRRAWPSEYQSR
jgi:hypothetical protein